MEQRAPRVGVGVIVLHNGLVLLGKRIGSHGAGTWAPPGGHLEFRESVEQCASREVLEETGLHIESVAPGPFTNDVFAPENKHYVTLFVVATSTSGEPTAARANKVLCLAVVPLVRASAAAVPAAGHFVPHSLRPQECGLTQP
jgi:8-oxo-dGTP diphosphatase